MNGRGSRGFAAGIARIVVGALVLAAVSCSSSKSLAPGQKCQVDSDCTNPLSCGFGMCHEACHDDRDCPKGNTCVYTTKPVSGSSAPRVRVCLDQHCNQNSACDDPLFCGRDLLCHNQCETSKDCPVAGQTCVIGGPNGVKVCAEEMFIGANGELVENHETTGAGGNGGGGEGANDGGDASDSGGAGGTSGADASPDSSADAGSDVAGDVAADVPPGTLPEQEPNDDRMHPTPYMAGTVVSATAIKGDVDYYVVEAPATDHAGGYFQLAITDVGMTGGVHVLVYSTTDNGRVGYADGADVGQSTSFFWAAAPGQKYHIDVYQAGGFTAPFPYTMKVTYTKIDDPAEPNDTRDTPSPITLGTPVKAYCFAGFTSGALAADATDDWYSLPLAVGNVTVTVGDVASNARLAVTVFDSLGNALAPKGAYASGNLGAGINPSFTVATAGTFRVRVALGAPIAFEGAAMNPTDNFTRPYTLTVTQP